MKSRFCECTIFCPLFCLTLTPLQNRPPQVKGDPRVRPIRRRTRQFLYNWGKSTQTLFSISIKPYFRVKESYQRSLQNNKERMVRPWVKVSLCQYEELKKLREGTDRPVSEIIREAVCKFVKKKDFPVNTAVSYLPKGTRYKYKSVSAYFSTSDWAVLEEISKNTGRCKTELILQAVDEYLGK